ncbi:hypothetical protein CEUSTIGMA_g6228.t1 [Chlamydomonas eustigma]|uniref:Histidine-containing phosphotransfer protein n=1 Tax=Chlamydomonas eustigma TaxID=1157962 RepID=A0A250X6T7_9CHLO|nr:hypothetical protein CEUSTIGMA_g6228.t1 [Chlamydomonas eustigma]|eukprot:GAX78791.1 hypothetical protein CEUSTIGMA_g6228.t1 [Chlamydomonas eustigma]
MDQSAVIQQHIDQLVAHLQQEGILDEQFQQLMQLQDDSNPDFVSEVVQLYFEDSVGKIERMGQIASSSSAPPNFNELDGLVHQFKGSSASLGAQMLAQLCIKLRECCQTQNQQGCLMLLSQIQSAYDLLKSKLDLFMQLEGKRKMALSGL